MLTCENDMLQHPQTRIPLTADRGRYPSPLNRLHNDYTDDNGIESGVFLESVSFDGGVESIRYIGKLKVLVE